MPVRPVGGRYALLVPPTLDGETHAIELRSATWRAPGDERAFGVPVGIVTFTRAGPTGLLPTTAAWLAAMLALWLSARICGFAPDGAAVIGLVGITLVAAAHLADAPRAAFAAVPAATALAGGAVGAAALRLLAPALLVRFGAPVLTKQLRWLLLLALVVFATRYGGKQVAGALPGDITFHTNRFAELAHGDLYLAARNRGVDFPYPPGFYLVLAPAMLAGVSPRQALHIGAALADALSPLLVYAVAAHALVGRSKAATLAAGMYALAGVGLLAHWWNFSTHIFTAFAFLVLLAASVALWARFQDHRWAWGATAGFAALQGVVALGHFGYWINTILAGAVAFVLAAGLARRQARAGLVRLFVALGVAHTLVVGLFYSVYTPQIARQAEAVAEGGTRGVLSDPSLLALYWETILRAGLRDHYALFLPPLALCGLAMAFVRSRRVGAVAMVALFATLIVALGFALLPFFSGANLASRWLSFAGCAICVGAAPPLVALWRAGAAGRLVALAIAGYALWIAATLWLAPLAWRIRPPEPF